MFMHFACGKDRDWPSRATQFSVNRTVNQQDEYRYLQNDWDESGCQEAKPVVGRSVTVRLIVLGTLTVFYMVRCTCGYS